MGTKAFTIIRGDDFQQPFTVTLDQSRTLDGSETWKFTVRLNKTSAVLLTLTSSGGGITTDAVTFQPTVVFTPADFSGFTTYSDQTYVYDLEMTKDGKFETYAIDDLTITGDVSR